MSTYNGEPYPGFFKRENETDEQYMARQPIQNLSIGYGGIVDENAIVSWDENKQALTAEWVEPYAEVVELRSEIAELRDTIKRTEDFVNSMLGRTQPRKSRNPTVSGNIHEDTEMDITVISTPINIPAKSAITGEPYDPILRKFPGGESLKHAVSLTRTLKPKKVRDDEDYDRAMKVIE